MWPDWRAKLQSSARLAYIINALHSVPVTDGQRQRLTAVTIDQSFTFIQILHRDYMLNIYAISMLYIKYKIE